MIQGEEEIQAAKSAVDGLEPYRRLIELQRQMIELVQQHEDTKRECATLRTQLSREMAMLLRPRQSWRQRMSQSASNLLKRGIPSLKLRADSRPRPNGSFLRTTLP